MLLHLLDQEADRMICISRNIRSTRESASAELAMRLEVAKSDHVG
jgi:hypothetical protein